MRPRYLIATTVAVIACFGLLVSKAETPDRYLTAPVELGHIRTSLMATGSLQAVVMARVGSQLSGQIEDIFVDFNDTVKRGQIMARLDSRTHEAKVRAAEAALEVTNAKVTMTRAAHEKAGADVFRARHVVEFAAARIQSAHTRSENARFTLERKQALVKSGTTSRAQLEDAAANHNAAVAELLAAKAEHGAAEGSLRAAEANLSIAAADIELSEATVRQVAAELEQARTDLAHTEILATTDGIVIGRDVEIGQTVAATLEAPTLFLIAQDLRAMQVYAKIDEADIGRVSIGQVATFSVDSVPGRAFRATVSQIRKAPSVIQNVVTYTVVLSVDNSDLILLPGMTALLQIVVDETKEATKVPNSALRFQPSDRETRALTAREVIPAGQSVVWVLGQNGEPVPVAVTLGRSDAVATQITAGELRLGQQVIVGKSPPDDQISFFGLRGGL